MMVRKAKRRKAEGDIAIDVSSGNVFEDLGLPNAGDRLAKAELARVIRGIIKEKNWTQREAADVLGIAAPDVSDLMRGKLARFSQERLERFLNALDMDVHIQVGPRAAGKKHASVTVQLVAGF
jgi:predicted XRE-type DNA-binding protein